MSSLPLTFLSLLCASPALFAQAPSYRVEFLGDGASASALNEDGVVVGWVLLPGDVSRAAISVHGEPLDPQPLPLPPGYQSSHAYDVNDSGLVVGAVSPFSTANIQPHAAAWFPTPGGYVVQVLGEPAGDLFSAATGVNNLGDIVGSSGTTPWAYWVHGVHFTASGPVVLPGFESAADVNDNRNVLNRNQLLDLDTLQLQTVPLPPGNWMGVLGGALNELDGFAGSIQGFSSTCPTFPIRWLPGGGWTFVGGCAQTTSATAINDLGDVLTYVYPTASRVRLEGIGDFAIGSLIDPSQGSWWVQYWGAADINNTRQLLAGVKDPTLTMSGAARLTPLDACGRPSIRLYCSAKTTSSGCVPAITTSGSPSAGAGSGFSLQVTRIEPGKPGLLFYGTDGPASVPFNGGFLCVKAPLRRLPAKASTGSGACAASLEYDFNAWIGSGADSRLVAGATVNAQFWFRDPASAGGSGLSGGVAFTLCD